MKNLDAVFISEKNKQQNKPIVLFIIEDYDDLGSNLYFADYDTDVEFPTGGQTYTKFPLKFETIGENTQGEVDAVRLILGNASRLIQSYLENYDLREKKVTIRIVWADQLSSSDYKLDYVYYIDSYTTTDEKSVFVCTTKIDIVERKLPGGIYLRTHCRYKEFKDADTCGYAGAETECNRTKARCKELDNFERFGGFPSAPTRRLYVA